MMNNQSSQRWVLCFYIIIAVFSTIFLISVNYDVKIINGSLINNSNTMLKNDGLNNSITLTKTNASFIGWESFDYSGYTVSCIGDVNNDTYDDIIIAAPFAISDRGRCYLFFGRDTQEWQMRMSLHNADVILTGGNSGDRLGISISKAGDTNNDGIDDILIGAYRYGADAGVTYLILGRSTLDWSSGISWINQIAFIGSDNSESGSSVSNLGDINQDGFDDFMIGAPKESEATGKCYLLFGRTSTQWNNINYLSDSNVTFNGEEKGDEAGWAVSGVGDVNMDGYQDFLIGSHWNSHGGIRAGQAYLFLGKTIWSHNISLIEANASFYGIDHYDELGHGLAGVGDFNMDGYDDFVIGAPERVYYGGDGPGQAFLFLGRSTGNWHNRTPVNLANITFIGEGASDILAKSVSGNFDFNDDGYHDFVIGAYENNEGGVQAGKTYLVLGHEMNLENALIPIVEASFSYIGELEGDFSGFSVSSSGDVNKDGFDDFLIGAYNNDEGGDHAGQTYLILGSSIVAKEITTVIQPTSKSSTITVTTSAIATTIEPTTSTEETTSIKITDYSSLLFVLINLSILTLYIRRVEF